MPQRLKLFLADDHQILIDGLIAFFKETDAVEVVGAANEGATVLASLPALQPDIVLLDLNMPRMDGLATLERIGKEYPQVRVIILSNYHQSELIKETRSKGAKGYLLKNGSKEELMAALEIVAAGGEYFSLDEQEPLIGNEFFADAFMKKHQLTRREVDIIQLICQEYSSRDIAARLFISEFTVNTHRRNIMRKLGMKNTVGVINFARENNLC